MSESAPSDLLEALAAAGFYMAGADGAFEAEELHQLFETLRSKVEFDDCEYEVQQASEKIESMGADAYLAQITASLSSEQKSEVLDFAKQIALSDGETHDKERDAFTRLAGILGLPGDSL